MPQEELLLDAFLRPEGTMTKKQVAAVRNKDEYLFVYGVIHYFDVYEKPHETRFAYIYESPQGLNINFEKAGFRHGGPAAYNRIT